MELNEKTKRVLEVLDGGNSALDQKILPLVNAINSLSGIRTRSSCGGHFNRYPFVHFWVDGSPNSMAGLCFISHAIKSYEWKLVALPVGSIGELLLEFVVLPGLALKDWDHDQSVISIRASSPQSVEIEQDRIEDIAGRLLALSKNSRYVPQNF